MTITHAIAELEAVIEVAKEFDDGKKWCKVNFLGGSFNAMAQKDFEITGKMQPIRVKVKLDSSKFRASIFNNIASV